ncbi:sensor histidine kinase [Paenibacillus endoradicis]|uniref:sensor histidine kinase n=1 Tax=Paenibacillus endoradicis TaxID=2972487 RepID=UPI002158C281|nr:histidine kinase [Paenibacillus endoradicis]
MLYRLDFSLRNTIFLRLLITFLLIMLPIMFFGAYLYHWIVQTAREDITKTAASQLSFYMTDLENEIERMKLLEYSLLDDDDLNKLALTWERMDTIDRTNSMNSLIKRLFTVQNSSMYIEDVSVHIATIGRTMSANEGVRDLQVQRFQEIRSVFGGPGSHVIEWNYGLFIGAVKQRGLKGAEPLFTVEIELNKQKLQQVLSQFNTYTGSGTVLLSEKANVMLGSLTGNLSKVQLADYLEHINKLNTEESQLVTIAEQRYYYVIAHSSDLEITIYRFIPEQVVQQPLNEFYKWGWIFIVAAIVIIAVFAFSTYRFIHKPMLTLVKSFRKMEHGDLDISIAHESKDEFRYLYGRFNQMVSNLRVLIDQAYKQKILVQRAELKQLQSQINPHFLYNSFFILNTMVRTGDVERMEQFTTLLGEYFQFVTRNSSDFVTLEQEVQHARMYTEIQQMRFSRRMKIEFNALPTELNQVLVPRLIVQPIIENVFKHSLEKRVSAGLIKVHFHHSAESIAIIVEDNGEQLSNEVLMRIEQAIQDTNEHIETTGMVNIHRRLQITFGIESGLKTERSELGGLKVKLLFSKGGKQENVQNVNR